MDDQRAQPRLTVSKLWDVVQQTTPEWLRLLIAAGLGSMIVFVVGRYEVGADILKAYIGVIGLLVTGAISFTSGRIINEAGDRRSIKRALLSANWRIQALRNEL